jgi:hypothetical protein
MQQNSDYYSEACEGISTGIFKGMVSSSSGKQQAILIVTSSIKHWLMQ